MAQKSGVPVLVNPVIAKDTMGDADLAMELKVGPSELNVAKKAPAPAKKLAQKAANGVPVLVNPVIAKDTMGDADLAMELKVGPSELNVAKKALKSKTLIQTGKATQPDDGPTTITVDGTANVTGLTKGDSVYGDAIVTGNAVSYNQKDKKRITGTVEEDPLPTFNWYDHYGIEQKSLKDVQAVNALAQKEGREYVMGDEDLEEVTIDGHKVSLATSKEDL